MKKDFKTVNPALAYISGGQEQETEHQAAEIKAVKKSKKESTPAAGNVPQGYRPAYVEARSKRVQVLIQPSLFDRLSKYAKRAGVSRNEAILTAISSYLEGREE